MRPPDERRAEQAAGQRSSHQREARGAAADPAAAGGAGTGTAEPLRGEEGHRSARQPGGAVAPASGRRFPLRWITFGITSLVIFVLGMLVVTGYEALTGSPLSGGDGGTTVGRAFRPQPADPSGPSEQRAPQPSTSEPAPTETGEPTAPETTGTSEPAPTGQQPGESAGGGTTTTAPAPTEQPQRGPTGGTETAPLGGVLDGPSGETAPDGG
ncbi:hypothetical protein [Salinifilum aidingensis]